MCLTFVKDLDTRRCSRSFRCESPLRLLFNEEASNESRIERYTAIATPSESGRVEQPPLVAEKRPTSPTSSVKANASLSTPVESSTQQYQQFPSQAARIPASHTQPQIDGNQPISNGTPLMHPHRETSWPVEGFADLHLSASEPRIFPGVVSRTQRRDSLRQSSMSETDDSVGVRGTGKGRKGVDRAVEEETDEEDAEDSA